MRVLSHLEDEWFLVDELLDLEVVLPIGLTAHDASVERQGILERGGRGERYELERKQLKVEKDNVRVDLRATINCFNWLIYQTQLHIRMWHLDVLVHHSFKCHVLGQKKLSNSLFMHARIEESMRDKRRTRWAWCQVRHRGGERAVGTTKHHKRKGKYRRNYCQSLIWGWVPRWRPPSASSPSSSSSPSARAGSSTRTRLGSKRQVFYPLSQRHDFIRTKSIQGDSLTH